MEEKQLLCGFEERYKFLYDLQVGGVPIYTCFRDEVLRVLREEVAVQENAVITEKGRIFPRRIFDTFIGFIKNKNRKTLVFTSSMFRRDSGRNLAAEYLMDRYSDSVVFEWPSRNDSFDSAYFEDSRKKQYVPLDGYILLMKVYSKLHKTKRILLEDETRKRLVNLFSNSTEPSNRNEEEAIKLLTEKLPISYAQTQLSQDVFCWLFKRYKTVETVVDFWGSARENIIPVLQGKPKSVELQHGIITSMHPGYIYPDFVKESNCSFFGRRLLVYGEKTKDMLIDKSIFNKEQIEVIGNPRIIEFRKQYEIKTRKRGIILFTSQPFEQDGAANGYYEAIIPILKEIKNVLVRKGLPFRLCIKLHPREGKGVCKIYKDAITECEIYDSSSQLFDLLDESFLHITASSTTLYEAALFGSPTVVIDFDGRDPVNNYGFDAWRIGKIEEVESVLERCMDQKQYEAYLKYLLKETMEYM